MKLLKPTVLLLCVLFIGSIAELATAQDIIIPPIHSEVLVIDYQRVDVTIEEQIATTRIDMLFVNTGGGLLEGTYLFPLPKGATVSELIMWVDGIPIEAKILGAAEARGIYDEIVRQLRDPALLEYVGGGAIQANVFPIPAGEERRIEIEYQQILSAENGLIRYTFSQANDLYTNQPLQEQSIRVNVRSNEALRTIYSPTHRVSINRESDFNAAIGYEASDVIADEDFELIYTVSAESIGLNLLSYKESGEDGFFLLLAAPSVEVKERVAKDVILVFDTSGSMEGDKMAQAQDAASYIVNRLDPEDRFNIIAFSTGTRVYQRGLVPATQSEDALPFINSLEAVGGTNISQALLEAMAMVDENRPTTLIFLTDGLATEGITKVDLLIDAVGQAAPDNVRLFAFGVGDDVDTFLLDSLTSEHRGTTTYVRPFEQIDEAVSTFYEKVSTPVLTDLTLDFGDVTIEQLYPTQLPDLFAGSQLIVAGRYRDGGPTTVTLTGTINNEVQTFVYEDNVLRNNGGDDFIPRLWASRAIGHLMSQIRLRGESDELVSSVVNLSRRYGIITPYTSFLIEEDDIFSQSSRDDALDEAFEVAEEQESADTSGSVAVDAASDEAVLRDAEVIEQPVAVPANESTIGSSTNRTPIQFVGNRTFIFSNGTWTDTEYNPDVHTPQQVGFASDNYFELLTAAPELGDVFALGEAIIVIYEGIAYEIVSSGGNSEIELPEASSTSEPVVNDIELPEATSSPAPAIAESDPTSPPAETTPRAEVAPSQQLCLSLLLLPTLAIGLIWQRKRQ